jgi:predicted neuraminidase
MKSKTAHWTCGVCVLLSGFLIKPQAPSPTPADSAIPQFDGTFRASSAKGREEAYFGKLFRSSHAANPVRLHNDDLLCFWFSGTREGEFNVAIVMSRLPKSSEQWSKPVQIDHQEGRSFQNPVAFQAPGGRLWLLHTSQPAGQGQVNAEVLYLTSDDAGQTWTAPRPLFTQPGSFIHHPPILISKKVWLLPMYYTPSRNITDGAELHYSAIKLTKNGGKSWKECRIPQSNGLVQQSVLKLAGRFLGFFRSRFADFIYQSTSDNGCDWTVPVPTHLPNNNSSIQSGMLRDGSLVIVFNNNSSGATREKTGDPFAGVRLFGFQVNAGRWLRQHDLCQMTIDHFELGLPLEAHNDWIVALAVLGDRCVKLGKTLQAGELVEHEPHPSLPCFGLIHEPQHEQVDPHALQRTERFPLCWERRDEDPSFSCLRPLRCGPLSIASLLERQEPKTLCNLTQRSQDADSLRRSRPVDEIRDLCVCDPIVDFLRVTHPFKLLGVGP